jgi:hypothetical protein
MNYPVTEKIIPAPALAKGQRGKEKKPGDCHAGLRYLMQ